MDINTAVELIKKELNQHRYSHTMRVVETAEKLASRFGADREKVQLAAALHDYAKNWPAEKLETYIQDYDLPHILLEYDTELWHGPVASEYVKRQFGMNDEEIIAAIRYHTTGKAGMGIVEKVIYLADYIEPGRNFPGLEEVREASEDNLDQACWLVARNTIAHLLSKRVTIHPDSLAIYNDLTRKLIMEGLLG